MRVTRPEPRNQRKRNKASQFPARLFFWLGALQPCNQRKNKYKIGQTFQFWQEGFHPKLIQNEAILRNKLEYIHNNPVARGYVDDPIHWRYSSYRNYMGADGILMVDKLA